MHVGVRCLHSTESQRDCLHTCISLISYIAILSRCSCFYGFISFLNLYSTPIFISESKAYRPHMYKRWGERPRRSGIRPQKVSGVSNPICTKVSLPKPDPCMAETPRNRVGLKVEFLIGLQYAQATIILFILCVCLNYCILVQYISIYRNT